MNPAKSIVVFGELLLRLGTPGHQRFVQAAAFEACYTGAEANVGASLAAWGYHPLVVSRVPQHEIGQACVNFLARYGLDTRYVQRDGDRLGVFFLETGASQRQSKVIYDRRHSAFTTFDDQAVDWDEVFAGRHWFHFSGTAPAVADQIAPVLKRACQAARRQGAKVSCDLNYRRNLWSRERAQAVMTELMAGVDVLICNEEDAEMVFGVSSRDTDVANGRLNREGYTEVAQQLHARFGLSHVAITLRESVSASMNNWSAMLFDGKEAHFSTRYPIQIVDRVGAGDSFAAGLIYGICENMSAKDAVEFATAASCLKHTIPGDFNLVSVAEVKALAGGNSSGRIQR